MTDEELIGYLFDGLDREESERVERAIESDALIRARLEELRRSILPLASDDLEEAPLGLAARTLSLIQRNEQITSRAEWSESAGRMRALDFAVVASVLSIAAVLVFPAIATLRGDQNRIVCADRLRQLGVAVANYTVMEGGQLPFVDSKGILNNAGSFAVALKENQLLIRPETLVCPAANNSVVLIPDVSEIIAASDPERLQSWRRHMGGSFGYLMGYEHFNVYKGRTLSDNDRPVICDRPPRFAEASISANSPNHGFAGQNVLFGDGSVRWLPSPQWRNDNYFLNDAGTVGAGRSSADVVIGVSEATPYPGHASHPRM